MCFINDEKGERQLLQPPQCHFLRDRLRRKVQEPERTGFRLAVNLFSLPACQRTVPHRRRNAHLFELRDLILHQRNQRGNHHSSALFPQEQLEAGNRATCRRWWA